MPEPIQLTVAEAAEKVGGTLVGVSSNVIRGICPLNQPDPNCIAFSSAKDSATILKQLKEVNVAALLIDQSLSLDALSEISVPLIQVAQPQKSLLTLLPLFYPTKRIPEGVHPMAVVAKSAAIAERVAIGPFAVIGENVVLEAGVQIHPHVVLYDDVSIGQETIIHSGAVVRESCTVGSYCVIQNGAVIGADGFGYMPDASGRLTHIPQVGNVTMAERVDLGANSCIDRAALGATVIGSDTKIDNQVQIGHNVTIGSASVLCGQVGIGGSSSIGRGVVLGGKAGVADHVTVGDRIRVGANSGVVRDLKEQGDYMGFPLMTGKGWLRLQSQISLLPKVLQAFKKNK